FFGLADSSGFAPSRATYFLCLCKESKQRNTPRHPALRFAPGSLLPASLPGAGIHGPSLARYALRGRPGRLPLTRHLHSAFCKGISAPRGPTAPRQPFGSPCELAFNPASRLSNNGHSTSDPTPLQEAECRRCAGGEQHGCRESQGRAREGPSLTAPEQRRSEGSLAAQRTDPDVGVP